MKPVRRRIRPLLVVSFLIGIGLGGFVLGAASSDAILAVAKDRYQDLQIFTKVLNLVQQYYVEEVDTQKLIYGGVKGMLQELDPHTNFLPPDVYKEFESETTGEFGGIGIELTVQNDVLTVISPIEDTPAFIAGIQSGDRIVDINGVSTKGFSLAEAAQHMRGKQGSKVKLKIFRDGFDKPKDFDIERGIVKVKSVKFTDLQDGYGYARLTSFIENTFPELEKNVKQMTASKSGLKGLILDLRRNPGGLLDQAVRVSDMFLEEGIIVSTIGRNKREKEVIHAKKEGTYADIPLIVLIDEYSASASEILAGALQDNKRALIMGQQSFGKGSVQSVVKLGDGSGLKLTVARYYTPSGRSIQAEGIKPDVLVENVDPEAYKKAVIRREVRREQDISGHLLGEKEQEAIGKLKKEKSADEAVNFWWMKAPGDQKVKLTTREKLLTEDYQVQQAYNYLRAWKVMERFQKTGAPVPTLSKPDATPTPKDATSKQ